MISYAWIKSRIDALKSEIEAHETASAKLASGTIQSYTYNSGQTVQTVTKKSLSDLQKTISECYSRLFELDARVGGGVVVAKPGF